MPKIAVIILISVVMAGLCAPGFCQDAGDFRQIKTVDGNIYDLDWAGSKVVVRWLDQYNNSFHDVVINVPDEAKIRKGTDYIEFSELEINDGVTARYYEEADGADTLITLEVTSP
jgi:hypothetical protein